MIELTTRYPCQRITLDPDFTEMVLDKVILLSHISYFDWIDDFIKIYFCIKMTNHNGRTESIIWHPFNEVSVANCYPIAEYNEVIEIPEWAIEAEVSLVNTDLLTGDEVVGVFLDFTKAPRSVQETNRVDVSADVY
ncbi:hypothetical protein QNI19_33045 [Cytophagaceae bacterium DM2B3-1]|uniref:Uncharacterized protein n=2 Tax=Xanthocytophaga TaxID=3078918 RepID=A0AAE3QUK9_9BACT|nr:MULTISPECIES: hypothetical protein [Xanthocytophaga]MDJ1472463.1 hypothetical protein [Xanthocytophaga flavus]MDJ1483658.1 hypothetical protein [Xanthocytophaga flavus]MDJ1497815.1 hypothetical protein [Xanthocytophaga flavus]MDJ1499377.1 hypothetical protein [Xanthocytophaga agilis]